jgi:hypothetical protein
MEHCVRYPRLLALPLLGVLFAMPVRAPAQVNLTVRFGTRRGPEIGVYSYAPDRVGDWRTNYSRWTLVTLNDVNGRYFTRRVGNARPVSMYRYQNEYFLPPRDQGWVNSDRRFNYANQPNDQDRQRARIRP